MKIDRKTKYCSICEFKILVPDQTRILIYCRKIKKSEKSWIVPYECPYYLDYLVEEDGKEQ